MMQQEKPPQKEDSKEEKLGLLGIVGEALLEIKNVVERVKNSRAVKIITSPAFARGISIASALVGITVGVLSLSGVSLGGLAGAFLAPQVAIPLAVASLTVVGIGIAVDTYMVRRTRRLHSESKHLSRHCLAKDVQDKIFEKNPNLSKTLERELYKPERGDKKSLTERYCKENSLKNSLYSSVILNGLKSISGAVVSLVEGIISRNPVKVLSVVGYSTLGLSSSISNEVSMEEKRNEFKKHIDTLRDREDSPGYDNLTELKVSARTQKIQTLALQELVNEPDYAKYSDAQIRERFAVLKGKIEKTEKAIRSEYAVVKLIKNFAIAHNPFSKYNNIEKLTTKIEMSEIDIKLKQPKKKIINEKIKKAARKINFKSKIHVKKNLNISPKKRSTSSRQR